MLITNIVLLLAFVAMIAIAVWLFRDGESPSYTPTVVRDAGSDDDDDKDAPKQG